MLKKFESLMLLQPPRRNVAATFTQTAQRRGARHLGFVEIAKQGNIDLLLHGDSITESRVQGRVPAGAAAPWEDRVGQDQIGRACRCTPRRAKSRSRA